MVTARPIERYIAFSIEILLIILLTLPPLMGWLLASAYILLRDAFMGGSVGKKILRLRVVTADGNRPVTMRESVLRNFPLAFGFLFQSIPLIGYLIGWAIAFTIFSIEAIILALTRRRLGDWIAGTTVIRDA